MNDIPCNFKWNELGFPSSKEDIEYFKNLMESVPPAIEFMLEHCKDARWDIIARAMDILERKFNNE